MQEKGQYKNYFEVIGLGPAGATFTRLIDKNFSVIVLKSSINSIKLINRY